MTRFFFAFALVLVSSSIAKTQDARSPSEDIPAPANPIPVMPWPGTYVKTPYMTAFTAPGYVYYSTPTMTFQSYNPYVAQAYYRNVYRTSNWYRRP
jgi:hypothetical protein